MAVATEKCKFTFPNLYDFRTMADFRKPLFRPISHFDICKVKPSKVRRFSQGHVSCCLWNHGWIPSSPSLGHFYFTNILSFKA